jgi:hypothetical protein
MTHADNLRRAIANTGKVFTEMAEEVRRKQSEEDRKELDALWHQALYESIKDGEQFTRYHFAALVAAAEREACAKVCDEMGRKAEGTDCCKWPTPVDCAFVIRARGKE